MKHFRFFKFSFVSIRPWRDARAIALARAITPANQKKGGLGRRRKARPKVNLHGLISPTPNAK